MAKHKYTTLLCGVIIAAMIALTCLFAMGESLGIEATHTQMPYAEKLFSTDKVHTLDIVTSADDWQSILDNATAKEYIAANLVIDGEAVKNVAIRTKGNSSLMTIASSDTDRYSFKIEFDHYEKGKTYYGLDKLALNNIAQDNTYLKDYLCYQMMGWFGADAPLCSFIWITVNGEDWGLYLAVEGIEEAFAERNYGSDYGQIYKPDNMDMGGGRNGGENGGMQRMGRMMGEMTDEQRAEIAAMFEGGQMPQPGEMPQFPGGEAETQTDTAGEAATAVPARGGGMGGGGFGGTDVALVYTDDAYDSYANIFDNAKFSPTDADKDRLIASLKQLGEGTDVHEVVNIEEVLRYFVVHNFVLNFDSYTGNMLHNYYLYEEDGVLSMIAWDYNLAFGSFGGMGGGRSEESVDSATSMVNFPIDSPLSGANMEDRPMIAWIFDENGYMMEYHALFDTFIETYFESGLFASEYDRVVALITPYVEKDPTAFCTYEEFVTAVDYLREFCLLRAESVRGQLDGAIPSTSEGQAADASTLVDGSSVDLRAMGSNASSFGRGRMDRAAPEAEGSETDTSASPPKDDAQAQGAAAAFPMSGAGAGGMPVPPEMPDMSVPETADVTEPTDASAAEETDAAEEAPPAAGGWNQPGGQWPGMGTQSQQNTQSTANLTYLYLGIAVAVLIIGLIVAKLFKH